MAKTPGGTQPTGQEAAENISAEARERAQEEFAHLTPGPSDPLQLGGGGGTGTQLDEDPISEVSPFQESRP